MNLIEAAKRLFAKDEEDKTVDVPVQYERAVPAYNGLDGEYLDMVREALLQWQAAQSYFESVSDPELVDYAIYDIEASRKRYIYMLKQAGREVPV